MADLKTISLGIVVEGADGAVAAIRKVGTATEQMEAKFNSIAATVSKFIGIFSVLLGLAAGGAVFGNMISETVRWNLEIGKLAKSMGITTQDASVFKVAMHSVGIEQDVAISAALRMAKTLSTNSAAFDELGVKTKNSNGTTRDTLSVLMDTVQALDQYKGGLDRNQIAMQIFGRSWGEVQQLMKLNPAIFEEARNTAQRLHLVVGPEGVKAAAEYKKSLNELSLVGESLKIRLGDELLPKLIELSVRLGEAAVTLAEHLDPFISALGAGLKIGTAYVILFTGIPKIFAAATIAIEAFSAATTGAATASSVLMLSFTSSLPLLWQAVDAFTKLRIAGSILMAAFAGFEIGTWLYNQFDIVKKFSIALVGGIMKLVNEAKYGFLELVAVGKGAMDWLKGKGYTGEAEVRRLIGEHAKANAYVDEYMDEELAKLGKKAGPATTPKPPKGKQYNPGPTQEDVDHYNEMVQKLHQQYLAYAKAFDDRVLAGIKEATNLQLAALDDRHSQGLVSEQSYLDQKFALEQDGLTREKDAIKGRYDKIAAATAEAEKKVNASKKIQGGKAVYDDVLLSAWYKDSEELEKIRKEYEAILAKMNLATQKHTQDTGTWLREQKKQLDALTLEGLRLQGPGNEQAVGEMEIYNQYREQLEKALNGQATAANPEELAFYDELVSKLSLIIARKTELADLDASAAARSRTMSITENQLQLAQLNGSYQEQIDLQIKLLNLKNEASQADPKLTDAQKKALADLTEVQKQQLELQKTPWGAFKSGLKGMYDEYSNTTKQMCDLARSTAGAMTQGFADFFFDAMQGKLKTLKDYFTKFLASIEQALAQVMAQKLVASAIGGAFHTGGLVLHEGGMVPAFHSGGLVLPSFHFGGLNSDERPAVLLTHERVLSREQNKLFERFVNKTEDSGGSIMVNVPVSINGGGTPAGTQSGNAAELGRMIKAQVTKVVTDQMRPGGVLYRG